MYHSSYNPIITKDEFKTSQVQTRVSLNLECSTQASETMSLEGSTMSPNGWTVSPMNPQTRVGALAWVQQIWAEHGFKPKSAQFGSNLSLIITRDNNFGLNLGSSILTRRRLSNKNGERDKDEKYLYNEDKDTCVTSSPRSVPP